MYAKICVIFWLVLVAHCGLCAESILDTYNVGLQVSVQTDEDKQIKNCNNGNARSCYILGAFYDKQQDFKKSMKFYEKACKNDYADACVILGIFYENGKGIKQDYKKAEKLYQKACASFDNGNVLSLYGCHNLGVLYKKAPSGIKQDLQAANTLFAKACKTKDELQVPSNCSSCKATIDTMRTFGCMDLAYAYLNGIGIQQDTQKALELWQIACDNKDFKACFNIAATYYNGEKTQNNLKQAEKIWLETCEKGAADSCLGVALLYTQNGTAPTKKAMPFLEKACNLGNANGCYNLGVVYHQGEITPKNLKKARALYELACNGGESFGCHNLANIFDDENNYQAANELFYKACDMGVNMACRNLGNSYRDGKGVQQDSRQAAVFFHKGCKLDDVYADSGACANLGGLYIEEGDGVEQNTKKAREFLQKACQLGEEIGCKAYDKLSKQ